MDQVGPVVDSWPNGIYYGFSCLKGDVYKAVASIGTNPYFKNSQKVSTTRTQQPICIHVSLTPRPLADGCPADRGAPPLARVPRRLLWRGAQVFGVWLREAGEVLRLLGRAGGGHTQRHRGRANGLGGA